ncbi:MAG: hypothetical protein AB1505_09170 [Candidatus Latescibacterota bacterium]
MLSLVLLLFGAFAVGALAQILAMLERPPADPSVERFRLSFFFAACLLLACLVPLWLAGLLTAPAAALDLAGVALNVLGWLLTVARNRPERASDPGEGRGRGIRTYRVYFQGEPFGLVTRADFEHLTQCGLLKRQRTVELVDDYPEQARRQGRRVQLLRNRDGSQTLIKVEALEDPRPAQ